MGAQWDSIDEWREQFARRALKVGFQPFADPFRGRIEPVCDGVVTVRHSPGMAYRDEELVKDGDDSFDLVIARSSDLDVANQQREFRLRRGEATLLHVCKPGHVGSCVGAVYYSVVIPAPDLTARASDPGSLVMRRLERGCEALQLLRAYLRFVGSSRSGTAQEVREATRRHILDLAVLALRSQAPLGESCFGAVVAARLSAALEWIRAHFEEPELNLAAVARSQRISPRHLQRLLYESGTSFTAVVNDLRLQRAFALLSEQSSDSHRISDIALQVGFSDISHFNRLFRSRFGVTPTDIRGQVAIAAEALPRATTSRRSSTMPIVNQLSERTADWSKPDAIRPEATLVARQLTDNPEVHDGRLTSCSALSRASRAASIEPGALD